MTEKNSELTGDFKASLNVGEASIMKGDTGKKAASAPLDSCIFVLSHLSNCTHRKKKQKAKCTMIPRVPYRETAVEHEKKKRWGGVLSKGFSSVHSP